MTPEYIAGFFDGEGCVAITRGVVRAEITQRADARRVLDRLQERYGGKVYDRPTTRSVSWQCTAQIARRFLEAIQPHVVLKRDQVDLALAFQARKKAIGLKQRTGLALPEAESAIRAGMAAELRAMKQYRFDVKA